MRNKTLAVVLILAMTLIMLPIFTLTVAAAPTNTSIDLGELTADQTEGNWSYVHLTKYLLIVGGPIEMTVI